jgi:hypothetical protein
MPIGLVTATNAAAGRFLPLDEQRPRIMVRTIATTLLAFMAAFAMLAGARADYQYPRTTPTFCEETPPLAPWGANGLGGIRSRDGIIGRESSTGPTFPSVCQQESTMHPIGDELPPQGRG